MRALWDGFERITHISKRNLYLDKSLKKANRAEMQEKPLHIYSSPQSNASGDRCTEEKQWDETVYKNTIFEK